MFITAWPAVRWGCRPGNDESLKLYQIWNFLLALKTVFIFCAISFKSIVGGLISDVPDHAGLLLVIIRAFKMDGALLILPRIIALVKPKFVVGRK